MVAIAKLFGVLSVIAGAICLALGVGYGFFNLGPGWSLTYMMAGASGLLWGALVYCIGEIAGRAKEAAEHLEAIRRQTAPAGAARPSRQEPSGDLDRLKGVFAER